MVRGPFFRSSIKGLCQGDLLSPILFNLVADVHRTGQSVLIYTSFLFFCFRKLRFQNSATDHVCDKFSVGFISLVFVFKL